LSEITVFFFCQHRKRYCYSCLCK